jgi:hypothetical protein
MADATKISLSEAYECLAAQIGHLAAADYLLRWGKEGVLDYYGRKGLRESRKKIKRREFTAELWIPTEPRLRDELLTEVNGVSYVVWRDVVMDRYQFERLRFERLPRAPAPAAPERGSEIVDLEVAAAETGPLATQPDEPAAEEVPAKVLPVGPPQVESEAPPPSRRRGPKPGTIDRFGEDDRALFSDITNLKTSKNLTAQEAAKELGDSGRIRRRGSLDSAVLRLARRYRKEIERPN